MFKANEDDGNHRRLQDLAAMALSYSGYPMGMQPDHSIINMKEGIPTPLTPLTLPWGKHLWGPKRVRAEAAHYTANQNSSQPVKEHSTYNTTT